MSTVAILSAAGVDEILLEWEKSLGLFCKHYIHIYVLFGSGQSTFRGSNSIVENKIIHLARLSVSVVTVRKLFKMKKNVVATHRKCATIHIQVT